MKITGRIILPSAIVWNGRQGQVLFPVVKYAAVVETIALVEKVTVPSL